MGDQEYFSHLYEIAKGLNREFALPSALRNALEKTIELLDLETGWIWLVQADSKSVYLAASHNLPGALSKHPERLSGYCYCIKKYLADDIEEATNISEIRCTRLKNIDSLPKGLKFHASIPITAGGEKVGLMNLMTRESQQLSEAQLSLLNMVSELIAMAIQRTRFQETQLRNTNNPLVDVINRVLIPQIESFSKGIESFALISESPQKHLEILVEQIKEIQSQVHLLVKESSEKEEAGNQDLEFHYPSSPLTKREREVLTEVKKGLSNAQIAEQLYITERTVKFHLSSILSKLYAQSRTEAVEIAVKRGLMTS